MNIILATTLFCRLLSPTAIAYAPDALVIDYPITNIEWHCEWPEGAAEPTKEWATTNITFGHRSVLSPEEPDYLAAGWLKNAILPPSPKEGMVVASKTYKAQGDEVLAVYEYAQAPEPIAKPKLYSRLSIYVAMTKLGIWDSIKTWLEQKTINGLNGWMAFQLAQEISSDHPLFIPLTTEARQLLGMTEEQFSRIMDECILEQ